MITALFGLLRPLWPYFAAFALGGFMAGGAAWKVQGMRLTAAQQEFTDFKQTQKQLIQEAKDAADKQRDQARENFTGAVKVLAADIEAGASYNRCLAAGKCGRVRDMPTCADLRVPPGGGVNAGGTDAVSAARDPAPQIVADCASTTLMLNQLQTDIENQPGYKK